MKAQPGLVTFQFYPDPPTPLAPRAQLWRDLCLKSDAQIMVDRVNACKTQRFRSLLNGGPESNNALAKVTVIAELVDTLKNTNTYTVNDPRIGSWQMHGTVEVNGKTYDLYVSLGDLIDRESAPIPEDRVNTDPGVHGALALEWLLEDEYGYATLLWAN